MGCVEDLRQGREVRLDELRLRHRVHPPLRRIEQPQGVPGHELWVGVAELVGTPNGVGFAVSRLHGRDQVQKGVGGRLVVTGGGAFGDVVRRVVSLHAATHEVQSRLERMITQI